MGLVVMREWSIAGLIGVVLIWAFLASTTEFSVASNVSQICFSQDRTMLATTDDQGVSLWEINTRRRLLFVPHARMPTVSYAGSNLAVAVGERIQVWGIRDRSMIQEFHASMGSAGRLEFMPDDRQIVSIADDGKLSLWDLRSQSAVFTVDAQESPAFTLAVSSDGRLIATGGSMSHDHSCEVRVWDARDGSLRGVIHIGEFAQVEDLAFFPSEDLLLVTAYGDGEGAIWDLSNLDKIVMAQTQPYIFAGAEVSISPDGNRIAYSYIDGYGFDDGVNAVALDDASFYFATSLDRLKTCTPAFSSDGQRLFVATRNKGVFEFDLATGGLISHASGLRSVRWCWQWSLLLASFAVLIGAWGFLHKRRREDPGDHTMMGRTGDEWLVPTNAVVLAAFSVVLHWDHADLIHEYPYDWLDFLERLLALQVAASLVLIICSIASRSWKALAISFPVALIGLYATVAKWAWHNAQI